MVYFDCAATTKPTEKVIQDITEGMRGDWYNPSSISEESRKVKLKIEHAREQVADFINANPEEIIFTSGGSESNNLAIRGFYDNCINKPYGLFCSKGEHPSIYNQIQRYKDMYYYAHFISLEKNGQIKLEELKNYLRTLYYSPIYIDSIKNNGFSLISPLVCISYINNEIGTVNDIQAISKVVHKHGGILLVDAVQAIGYKTIDVKSMGIDMLSASFHKFGGVRGCGFLYVKKGIKINPLIYGGHQENNFRAGTEASYLITAMGNRLEELKKTQKERTELIANLRYIIINKLFDTQFASIMKINGTTGGHIISLTIKGIPSQELITLMNIDGVIVSAGSACSSGEEKPSRVLKAIGLSDEDAKCTIRISFNEFTTNNDVDLLIESLIKNINIIKELHSEDKNMKE